MNSDNVLFALYKNPEIKKKKGRPIIDMCRDDGCAGCNNFSCAGKIAAITGQNADNKEGE